MKKSTVAIAAALLATAAGTIAYAATPAQTIAARQAQFKLIGKSFKAIRDELQKSEPGLAVIRTSARDLNSAARKVGVLFPKGSGAASGVKTSALPAIWEHPVEFKASMVKFQSAAKALDKAGAAKNLDAIKASVGAIGATCGGCHKEFRAKD